MQTLAQLKSGVLQGISELKLSEALTVFPQEIFGLAETLVRLDLTNNLLSELPDNFGELHQLKILFLSENRFEVLPKVLAQCPNLEMIGFKSNQIHTVPEGALPPLTRWLILTDNQIARLPDEFDRLPRMQKLMLAGNRLTALPRTLSRCHQLELLRISGNQLSEFPAELLALPKLSWLAFSGNPFSQYSKHEADELPTIDLQHLDCSELLGQGASGFIYRAKYSKSTSLPIDSVAVKLFKGDITSDGYPIDELFSSIRAGQHPNLVTPLASVKDAKQQGLVMPLIPSDFSNLGLPPSLKSCTRDCFPDSLQLSLDQVVRLSLAMCSALSHLHDRALMHGDLYAHNVLHNSEGDMLLGDFGAASPFDALPEVQQRALCQLEVRALGCFIEDLLSVCRYSVEEVEQVELLQGLVERCCLSTVALRPNVSEVCNVLKVLMESRPL